MKKTVHISKAVEQIREHTNNVIQETFSEMGERIVDRTPVDKGTAKGNWNASIGMPDYTTTTRTDPSGFTTTAKIKKVASNANIGDVLYLANGIDYIGVLERGSSTQAPKGMVSITLEEHDEILRQKAR